MRTAEARKSRCSFVRGLRFVEEDLDAGDAEDAGAAWRHPVVVDRHRRLGWHRAATRKSCVGTTLVPVRRSTVLGAIVSMVWYVLCVVLYCLACRQMMTRI